MTTANRMLPVHPGEILKEEMDERDLSANALARAIDVPTNRITSILNGQRGITANTALQLSRCFGTTPELWLNLQKTWDLRTAEIESEGGKLVKFVPMTGSTVGGRYKDKKESITEALSDLQLAIGGFEMDTEGPYEIGNLSQRLSALGRLSSIFLRKLVLGDRGVSKTRLLDDAVMDSLEFKFQPLRNIPRQRRRTIKTGFGVGGGFMQITKVDESDAKPTQCIPVAPQDLVIEVEWPLPGMVDWIGVPSEREPWPLCAEQLFDTASNRTLSCTEWLGQQVVVFDNRGISLKEIIRTVVNFEGAHTINVGRLAGIDGEVPHEPVPQPDLHILHNVTLFGVRYFHSVVLETALYLYERLMREASIERPGGDFYLVKPGFACSEEQERSSRPDWLRFEGTMMAAFGRERRLTQHHVRPVS